MITGFINKLFITSLSISLFRLIYIFFLKEFSIDNQFNSYVFTFSVLAIISSCISPVDAMCSRFVQKNNYDDLYEYLIFHLFLRFFIGFFIFSVIILSSSVLDKVDLFFTIAIALGIFGMIISNLIYIVNIGRGVNTKSVNFIFILPIIVKCFTLALGWFCDSSFREIVILSEFTQFIFCAYIFLWSLKKYKKTSLTGNLKGVAKNFIFELKNYGSNAFILIPISYVKTNFAPALAANNLNPDQTFVVVLIQRAMDLVKSILGRMNILTSGLKSFYLKTNVIFNFWIIPLIVSFCLTLYIDIYYESLLLFFVLIRITELFAFLSVYGAHSEYLKLSSYTNNRHVVLVPGAIFIISMILIELLFGLSFYNFAWLFLFRSITAGMAYYLFSRNNKIRVPNP